MGGAGEKNEANSGALIEELNLTLSSALESVQEIESAAEGMALRAGFDEDTASNIAMATHEAAVNAAKHGNAFSPDKRIDVHLQRTEEALEICIADEGAGLDPDAIPDPRDPANLLRASGRGVFLMRAIMDEVHFRQLAPGTEVTLVKRRNTEANS